MLFRSNGKVVAIPPRFPVDHAISLDPERIGMSCYGWENAPDIEYLGHARDLIKIADDAHELTGAELVGKYCEYCDIDGDWDDWRKGECKDFTPGTDQPYLRDQGGRFRFARLAR